MPIAYASRFLNTLEEKYSVDELELLGVVWAIEHFKYYLCGKHFTVITDHQALISALNASERSKKIQSRLTRWIDRLIPFHFDIKHLAGSKMGLIDYMSRNPVGLPKPPSEYDEEFLVAAINTFINNLEMIDNVILNQLANQNKAPYDLIKKRAENKRLLDARTNAQLTTKHFKHFVSGQLLPKNRIESNSNSVQNHSTLSHSKNLNCSKTLINAINLKTMSRKDTKNFSGGFFPAELKTTKPRGRTVSVDWRNTSDREESLSDPRWHKRPPTKEKQMKKTKSSPQYNSTAQVSDARKLITRPKHSISPKIIFGDSSTSKPTVVERNISQTAKPQTDTAQLNIATQTTINTEMESQTTKSTTATQKIWVSRVDPSVVCKRKQRPTWSLRR